MEQEPRGGEGLPSRGKGHCRRREGLFCSVPKQRHPIGLWGELHFTGFHSALLTSSHRHRRQQVPSRLSGPRARVGLCPPPHSPRHLAGSARDLQILPDPPSSCYLGGTIIFLCGEARCQESPEQDGEAEQRSDPLSAWRGRGRPGEALPSLAWGPILQWRVPLSGRGRGAAAPKGSWAGRKEAPASQ